MTVAEQLRRENADLPVVMFVARDDTATHVQALRAGASAYLAKRNGTKVLPAVLEVLGEPRRSTQPPAEPGARIPMAQIVAERFGPILRRTGEARRRGSRIRDVQF